MNRPSIAFAGTGSFAVPCLDTLTKISDVKIVITQPTKPFGKKQTLGKSPVRLLSESLNLPLTSPAKIEDINDKIRSLNPDLMIVADYGQIIPSSTLVIPRLGCLNIH